MTITTVFGGESGDHHRPVTAFLSADFTFEEIVKHMEELAAGAKAARIEAEANGWQAPKFYRLYQLEGDRLPPATMSRIIGVMRLVDEVKESLAPELFICGKSSFMLTMGRAFTVMIRTKGKVFDNCEEAVASREKVMKSRP